MLSYMRTRLVRKGNLEKKPNHHRNSSQHLLQIVERTIAIHHIITLKLVKNAPIKGAFQVDGSTSKLSSITREALS